MKYSRILAPIDISYENISWTQDALDTAVELARQSNGELDVLTVVPENLFRGYYPDLYSDDVSDQARNRLEEVVRKHCPQGMKVNLEVARGGICSEIIGLAKDRNVDAIVMASHGPMTRDFLLGSNAAYIALHAPCSVFIVRGTKEKP